MTRSEHLMVIAMEECNELAQRISKASRFGLNEKQSGQALDNRQRILLEYADLVAAMQLMGIDLTEIEPTRIFVKKQKVERYLAYAKDCGTLTE